MHRFLTFFFFINFKNALYKAENEYKIIQQKIKMGQNYGLIKVWTDDISWYCDVNHKENASLITNMNFSLCHWFEVNA